MVEVEEDTLRREVGLPEASILVKSFPSEEVEVDMAGRVD